MGSVTAGSRHSLGVNGTKRGRAGGGESGGGRCVGFSRLRSGCLAPFGLGVDGR
jgi:hypothetical protein